MNKLKKINVLLTGSGAPGTKGTVYSLKKNEKNQSNCWSWYK